MTTTTTTKRISDSTVFFFTFYTYTARRRRWKSQSVFFLTRSVSFLFLYYICDAFPFDDSEVEVSSICNWNENEEDAEKFDLERGHTHARTYRRRRKTYGYRMKLISRQTNHFHRRMRINSYNQISRLADKLFFLINERMRRPLSNRYEIRWTSTSIDKQLHLTDWTWWTDFSLSRSLSLFFSLFVIFTNDLSLSSLFSMAIICWYFSFVLNIIRWMNVERWLRWGMSSTPFRHAEETNERCFFSFSLYQRRIFIWPFARRTKAKMRWFTFTFHTIELDATINAGHWTDRRDFSDHCLRHRHHHGLVE